MATNPICIDASFMARLVLQDPSTSRYADQWQRWSDAQLKMIAPTLIFYEVTNVFHRYVVTGQISPERAQQLLTQALALEVTVYQEMALHQQALSFAQRFSLPASYDAHYLALSEKMHAEFWSADRRLIERVQSTLAWVNLLE